MYHVFWFEIISSNQTETSVGFLVISIYVANLILNIIILIEIQKSLMRSIIKQYICLNF